MGGIVGAIGGVVGGYAVRYAIVEGIVMLGGAAIAAPVAIAMAIGAGIWTIF